ncbi:MAG TPA: hypothetical protein G4N98_00490 [Thermoflexia bacterium]|nr:hypothetical protein [Thermoflexia bacterium]
MKKVSPVLRRSFTLFLLAGMMGTVLLTCQTMKEESETELPLLSPIRPGTATPLAARDTSPLATLTLAPMAAKATVAALGSQHKSEATPRPLTPIQSSQDVISAVLNDPLFKRSLDDSAFGPRIKDAIPGEPVFVISLDPKKNDYYLVPFYKNQQVSGIAVVGVVDGAGILGMWSNATYDKFPVVDSAEAQKLIEAEGFKIKGEPRLVFRWLRESGDETSPFWEVETEEGITFYVIHIMNKTKIYRADEVHPIG